VDVAQYQPYGVSIMPLKKQLVPVVPNCVRKIQRHFAWLDHRLRSEQWIADFEPEEFALYLFLALVADQHGLSCWRLDIIGRAMPAFHSHQFRNARDELVRKRLLAFRPWNSSDPDGTYQLLTIPTLKPKEGVDLATALAGILKSVS
jgi:hypothetical protein